MKAFYNDRVVDTYCHYEVALHLGADHCKETSRQTWQSAIKCTLRQNILINYVCLVFKSYGSYVNLNYLLQV